MFHVSAHDTFLYQTLLQHVNEAALLKGTQQSSEAAPAWAGGGACACSKYAQQWVLRRTSSLGNAGKTVKERHWLCPSALLGTLHNTKCICHMPASA